jgi:hypothetical protein
MLISSIQTMPRVAPEGVGNEKGRDDRKARSSITSSGDLLWLMKSIKIKGKTGKGDRISVSFCTIRDLPRRAWSLKMAYMNGVFSGPQLVLSGL